jgi:hypothetical protein
MLVVVISTRAVVVAVTVGVHMRIRVLVTIPGLGLLTVTVVMRQLVRLVVLVDVFGAGFAGAGGVG